MNRPVVFPETAAAYGFTARERIVLRECVIQMYLGLHDHERKQMQRVTVTVEVEPERLFTQGGYWDYDPLHDFLKQEIAGAQIETQEELCHRIAGFILERGGTKWLRVSSAKPDIFDSVAAVGYSLELTRSN